MPFLRHSVINSTLQLDRSAIKFCKHMKISQALCGAIDRRQSVELGVDGRAGTILLSRREYNPPEAVAATGRRRPSIDPRTDLQLIGVFYRAVRLLPASVYPHSGYGRRGIGRASNSRRTRLALWSLLSSRRNRRVTRRRTRSADRDCVKRSLSSVRQWRRRTQL